MSINQATPEEWNALQRLSGEAAAIEQIDSYRPKPTSNRDKQVAGQHYKNSSHQPLEIVLHTEGYEAFRGACLTKIYKYLQRHKGERLEDFQKAQHIMDWLVEETQNRADEEAAYEKDKGFY